MSGIKNGCKWNMPHENEDRNFIGEISGAKFVAIPALTPPSAVARSPAKLNTPLTLHRLFILQH
jgi:hypothetical protein